MSFDGSDDHIDTTDYALYSMATTGSLSFWINPATAHNNDIIIDNTDASSGNNGFMVRFEDPTGNQAKMKFAIWGPTDSWVLTDEIFTENEWQHVAIVYDGSTGKIYRNGVESVTSSSSSGAMTQNTNTPTYQTRIGEASNDNDNPYHGLMDEVYHFANKALTQAEVTSIYNAGLAGKQLSDAMVSTSGEGTYLIDESGVHDAVYGLRTTTSSTTVSNYAVTWDSSTLVNQSINGNDIENGTLTTSGNFYKTLKAVKDKFPKS